MNVKTNQKANVEALCGLPPALLPRELFSLWSSPRASRSAPGVLAAAWSCSDLKRRLCNDQCQGNCSQCPQGSLAGQRRIKSNPSDYWTSAVAWFSSPRETSVFRGTWEVDANPAQLAGAGGSQSGHLRAAARRKPWSEWASALGIGPVILVPHVSPSHRAVDSCGFILKSQNP